VVALAGSKIMNQTLLAVFVGITALAIIIQMAMLIALYVSSKKAHESLRSVARQLEENVLPLFGDLRTLLGETGPKFREAVENLQVISATVRQETERLGQAADEITTRVRLQATRIDEMFSRTLDRVEHTGESVQQAMRSPARQISGVLSGVAAAIAELRGSRKWQRQKTAVPRDEMFI
jgi:methyl-accepting chemotaxis protein